MAKTGTGHRQTPNVNTGTTQQPLPLTREVARVVDMSDAEFIDEIDKKLEENPFLENKLDSEQGSEEPTEDAPLPETETEQNPDTGTKDDDTPDQPDFNDGDDDFPEPADNGSKETTPFEQPQLPSLNEYLNGQLAELDLTEREKIIAEVIIGSLNEKGLLDDSASAIAQTLNEEHGYGAFNATADVEPVLKKLQQLDPPGIAARDRRECLIIQLERYRHEPEANLLRRIIADDFDGFLKIGNTPGQKERLCHQFGISLQELNIALHSYRLTFCPAAGYDSGKGEVPIIDFEVIVDENNEITVEALNRIPELQISANIDSADKAIEKHYIKPAKDFIEVMRRRQTTLMRTIKALVRAQREFFLSGNRDDLRPLTQNDIADQLGIHTSSISRVTSRRWVQTAFGNIRLGDLFIGAVAGSDITREKIMSLIKDFVDHEDKTDPLSDDKIATRLANDGFKIARRTVQKYRQELGIAERKLRQQ